MPAVAPYFFASTFSDFLEKSDEAILGALSAANPFPLTPEQRDAWLGEIALLRTLLPPYRGRGSVFFEFSIPRMGRRVDVALILDGVVFVLEFKVGARKFLHSDRAQVWDYALDLKNFTAAASNSPSCRSSSQPKRKLLPTQSASLLRTIASSNP